jgi:hypothetical protein
MADVKHPRAVEAEKIVESIIKGTLPSWHPKADPTGTPWIEVTKMQTYDPSGGFYREHGRQGVGSGKRV